ncbi:MAG: CAP domain-containing protein [Actinobacteria bacterium]|nr:MAG: CAP domain-containing protein [Actinomycetota bacterium]
MARFHVRGHLFEENLAYSSGVMSARTAVADWLASPEHRTILLDPTLRRIGVATPIGAFGGFARATVVTADFAR